MGDRSLRMISQCFRDISMKIIYDDIEKTPNFYGCLQAAAFVSVSE